MSGFKKFREVNVNDKIEKKNGLSYLSWAWAVDQLLSVDENANWEYLEPLSFGDTLMVRCSVTALGKTMTAQLPVMDYKNKAIHNPNAFDVNTAMQRCLAKAIALHGLGLYIYAGEDVPPDSAEPEKPASKVLPTKTGWEPSAEARELLDKALSIVRDFLNADMPQDAATYFYTSVGDQEEQLFVWNQLTPSERKAIKSYKEERKAA